MADFMESLRAFAVRRRSSSTLAATGWWWPFASVGGRAAGASSLDQQFGILCTLRDGKIARMEWFDSLEEAVAAARAQN
jgi:hypothetical protein